MPVIEKCSIATRAFFDRWRKDWNEWVRTAPTLRLARRMYSRADNYFKALGPAGRELARQLERVVRPARQAAAGSTQDAAAIFKRHKLRPDETELVGKIINGRDLGDIATPRKEVFDAANDLRDVLVRTLDAAEAVGFRRRSPLGGMDGRPLRQSGPLWPEQMNDRGRKIFDRLERRGASDKEVAAFLDLMVTRGMAPNNDVALTMLYGMRDGQLQGIDGHFTQQGNQLPSELIDWNPLALEGAFNRQWRAVEGARVWGTDHSGLNATLGRLSKESGRSEGQHARDFIDSHWGRSKLDDAGRSIAGNIRTFQTISKLSGPWSSLRNYPQRFTNNMDRSLFAHAMAFKERPPIVRRWMRGAKLAEDEIRRSGALRGRNSLADLDALPWGDRSSFWNKAKRAPIRLFVKVAKGNEFVSAHIAKLGLEADMQRLIQLEEGGTVREMFDVVTMLSVDPKGTLRRRIARSGIDPDEALKRFMDEGPGARFTPDEVAVIMQKAVEDEQFPIDILTEGVLHRTTSWFPVLFQFSTFGIRQTGFMVDRIGKEALRGNVAPLIKTLGALFVFGEIHNLSRDLFLGGDRSVTKQLLNSDPDQRDYPTLVKRAVKAIADQGGLGMIQDLTWGIEGWLLGPSVAGTFPTMLEAANNIAMNPSDAGTAIKLVVRREVPAVNQFEGILNQSLDQFRKDAAPITQYRSVRNQAFTFRDREAGVLPTLVAGLQESTQRALLGPRTFQTTPRSLRYRFAADAISRGDLDDATGYIASLFGDAANFDEIDSIERGLTSSRNRQAPLGPLNEDDQQKFLRSLTSENRRGIRQFNAKWKRDYDKAIRQGRREARRRARGGT